MSSVTLANAHTRIPPATTLAATDATPHNHLALFVQVSIHLSNGSKLKTSYTRLKTKAPRPRILTLIPTPTPFHVSQLSLRFPQNQLRPMNLSPSRYPDSEDLPFGHGVKAAATAATKPASQPG